MTRPSRTKRATASTARKTVNDPCSRSRSTPSEYFLNAVRPLSSAVLTTRSSYKGRLLLPGPPAQSQSRESPGPGGPTGLHDMSRTPALYLRGQLSWNRRSRLEPHTNEVRQALASQQRPRPAENHQRTRRRRLHPPLPAPLLRPVHSPVHTFRMPAPRAGIVRRRESEPRARASGFRMHRHAPCSFSRSPCGQFPPRNSCLEPTRTAETARWTPGMIDSATPVTRICTSSPGISDACTDVSSTT